MTYFIMFVKQLSAKLPKILIFMCTSVHLPQSSIAKKMAAVHSTTVTCKPNKGHFRHKESIEKTLCVLALKVLELFCTHL